MTSKSYITSSNIPKPVYATIVDLFKQRVKEHPDKEALVHRRVNGERRSITYRELQKNAEKLARYLIIKGVRKGDRVALSGLNTIEWVVAEFAIYMTGATLLNIGYTVVDHVTVTNVLQKGQCKMLIFDMWGREKHDDVIFTLLTDFEKYRALDKDEGIPGKPILLLRKSDRLCYQNLQEIMDFELPEVEFPVIYPEEPVLIFSTSGSVGQSKLIEHSHCSRVNSSKYEVKVPHKFYNIKHFGHAGGSPAGYICSGQTRVFVDSATLWCGRHTKEIWEIIKSENCTAASLSTNFLSNLISIIPEYQDSFKLELIVTGGEIIDIYFSQVLGVFCNRLQVGYGMAETGVIASISPLIKAADIETGNVGEARYDKEVKIVDTKGETTDRGVPGEICVRSNFKFRGYVMSQYDGPGEYMTQDNWFKTGDIGYITKSGGLIIVGRTTDFIVRALDHVRPVWIEGIALEMEGIQAVVAVPVPVNCVFQEICVCYIPNDGMDIKPEQVKEFFRQRYTQKNITEEPGDIPMYYLNFDVFPLLPSRKINRREVKAIATKRLGITVASYAN